jgi:hypothetical protein
MYFLSTLRLVTKFNEDCLCTTNINFIPAISYNFKLWYAQMYFKTSVGTLKMFSL